MERTRMLNSWLPILATLVGLGTISLLSAHLAGNFFEFPRGQLHVAVDLGPPPSRPDPFPDWLGHGTEPRSNPRPSTRSLFPLSRDKAMSRSADPSVGRRLAPSAIDVSQVELNLRQSILT